MKYRERKVQWNKRMKQRLINKNLNPRKKLKLFTKIKHKRMLNKLIKKKFWTRKKRE